MTATLTRRDNRDSMTVAEAERHLLAAGYRLTVYPQLPDDTCIARLAVSGFQATVVLAHQHVHQIVMVSRQDTEGAPLRMVSVKTGFHRNHEFLPLDIAGAVHIAEAIARDIEHAEQLAAGAPRWEATR